MASDDERGPNLETFDDEDYQDESVSDIKLGGAGFTLQGFNLHQLGAPSGFFIEFDSLIAHFSENGRTGMDWSFGGQLVHLAWSIENSLFLLKERGALFSLLVIESNIAIHSNDPSLILARKVLLAHFINNAKCSIYILDQHERTNTEFLSAEAINTEYFKGVWKGTLLQLIGFTSPSFVLLSSKNSGFARKCTQLGITVVYWEGAMTYSRTMLLNTAFVHPPPVEETACCNPCKYSGQLPDLNTSSPLTVRQKVSVIALYKLYRGFDAKDYLLEFMQIYLLHLISLENVSFAARAHILPKIDNFLNFSPISAAFKTYWSRLQIDLADTLDEFSFESLNDVGLVDLQDGRMFWKLVLIFFTKPAPSSPTTFEKFFGLPDDASLLFNSLWSILKVENITWPPESWNPPSDTSILNTLPRSNFEFFPTLYDIPIKSDSNKIENPENVLIPCYNSLVDEVRVQYDCKPEICYNIVSSKEVKAEFGGDIVYDNWEDALESEDDSVLESDIPRGDPPYLIRVDEPLLKSIKFVDFDMELYWFASSRNDKLFKKKSKNDILIRMARTYQNLRTILEKNSASLNLTGFKRSNGFNLVRPPRLPSKKEEVPQVQALPAKSKKKAKPGSKKSVLLAKEAKINKKIRDKEEEDHKSIFENIKSRFSEIGKDFLYLWNLIWTKFTIPKYVVEVRIWFLQLMKFEWVKQCRLTHGNPPLDDDCYPVLMYRLAADTWFDYPKEIDSDIKYQNNIIECFDCIGFISVSRQFRESFNLFNKNVEDYQYRYPDSKVVPLELVRYSSNTPVAEDFVGYSDTMRRVHVNMSPVRFQMHYMGHLMDRSMFSKKDPRVPFYPDIWQTHLLDLIDQNVSVLVCAPTSSGKTFASFYMIERVLETTEDGVVVYVCPTKALVNQAEADIYARFKNFEIKEGQRLVGPCLREYRTGSYEPGIEEDGKEPYEGNYVVRVLVTVPTCFEQLLFSISAKLRPNIRGVIFDEIHCLNESSESGGLIWENMLCMVSCPFLALSATIGSMDGFSEWLQSLREKIGRVELIHVKERFSDIRLSAWIPKIEGNSKSNTLIQIHPISFLLNQYHSQELFNIPQTMTHKADLIDSLNLTALESIQLYDQFYAVSQREPMKGTSWANKVHDIEPEKLFSNYICITQSMQRQWSKELLMLMKELAMDSSHYEADRVARNLVNYSYSELPPLNSTEKELINLVAELREKNKLPALVFCFSSAMCHKLAEALLDAFSEEEVDIADSKEEGKKFTPLVQQGHIYSEYEMNENIAKLRKKVVRVPNIYFECLKYGIGIHYLGLDKKFLIEVERLFREKHLQVVISTNTLALGVNMPCHTVIFAQDSPELNSVQYRQMSGRAGRRGYDYIGDVVFCGIGVLKIQRLFFSKIPPLVGSFPITSSLILRIMTLYSLSSVKEVENITLGLINLTSKTLYGWNRPEVQKQMWFHFRYTIEHLWNEYLLNVDGNPIYLSGTITNLSHFESFSLFLHSFLLNPTLMKLSEELPQSNIELQIVNIFSRFVIAPITSNEIVPTIGKQLESLHPELEAVLEIHNRRALDHYSKTLQAIFTSLNLGEELMPFTKISLGANHPKTDGLWATLYNDAIKYKVRSKFVATSGLGDSFKNSSDICFTIRNDIPLVPEAIPVLTDHDMFGKKLYYTNHMLDFYANTGELTMPKSSVLSSYDLNDNLFYDQLKLMTETVESLYMVLEKTMPHSKLTQIMKNVTTMLLVKFSNNYPQSRKNFNKLRELKTETTEEEKYVKQMADKFIRKYKRPTAEDLD